MESSFTSSDSLYPGRGRHDSSVQQISRISHKSSSPRKPQNFLSAVKDFMHRGNRSVNNLPTSRSTNELTIEHPHVPPRSKSVTNADKPIPWKQRGQTPGMDDYLTLAELESIWVNQDSYVGGVEAPQRITGYHYVEAVEAPTSTKHQIQPEATRPTLPQLRIPKSSAPSPLQIDQDDDALTSVVYDPGQEIDSDPVSEVPTPESGISDPSPERASVSMNQVRNAVVSGIVHPALRPSPYFDSNSPANCRLTSRFAVDVPSSNWTYGRV